MKKNQKPRIAIIGAGPGGLTLARVLQTYGISTTIFEREISPNVRSQGGSLDLHRESGQLAIQMARLDEQFRAIARYEDQGFRFFNQAGQLLFETKQAQEPGDRPEVDRIELRKLLWNSLAPGTIRWGCNLRSVNPMEDGMCKLLFENGLSETFNLVVGADGAWSRVRPLLSDATPVYTGVTFIEFGLDEVDQQHPAQAQLVGHGIMFALANNKGIIAQRNGYGRIRVYAAIRIAEKWESSTGFDVGQPSSVRTWLLDQFSGWDQSLLALIYECDNQFVTRPLYMLPIGHRWNFRAGVTLLGDAAHLMSPFSGEGVNLAMLDAACLAQAISEFPTIEEAVRTYEETMFVRAESAARGADHGLNSIISPDVATSVPAFFRR